MLEKHGEEWGDKVKIIGLSIDQSADTVKKHIEAKGWTKPIHYWRSKSNCSDVYSVRGVPHVMLIDTKGKIVFKGHPANRPDLAADLTNILKGEEISGEGCAAAEVKEGEEPKIPEGFKEATDEDVAAKNKEMDTFKETSGKELQEECKEKAGDMPRCFCVMVLQTNLMPSTMKWVVKFENYRVLVGSKENIDFVKEKCAAKLEGGTFEVVERT